MPEPKPARLKKPDAAEPTPENGKYAKLFELFQATRQDPKQRQDFIEGCRSLVSRVINRFLHENGITEDLTQDALIRILQHFDNIAAESAEQLGVFVGQVAKNVAFDHLRAKKRKPENPVGLPEESDEDISDGGHPDNIAFRAALREPDFSQTLIDELGGPDSPPELIESAIARLRSDWQQVIRLHYFEDKKLEEIAEILGIRVGTVKSRLSRARGRLEQLLAHQLNRESQKWQSGDFLIYRDGKFLPIAHYGNNEDIAIESIRYLREKYDPAFISARHALEVFQKGPRRCSEDERVLAGLFWVTTQRPQPLFDGSWGRLQRLAEGIVESEVSAIESPGQIVIALRRAYDELGPAALSHDSLWELWQAAEQKPEQLTEIDQALLEAYRAVLRGDLGTVTWPAVVDQMFQANSDPAFQAQTYEQSVRPLPRRLIQSKQEKSEQEKTADA